MSYNICHNIYIYYICHIYIYYDILWHPLPDCKCVWFPIQTVDGKTNKPLPIVAKWQSPSSSNRWTPMRPSTSARPQVKWPLSTVPELAEATAGISDVFSVKWDIWSHTAWHIWKKASSFMILDDFGWFWGVQVYSSLFIDMSQDHIASVRQPPWAAIRGFGAMPASLFFWTKLCKFAMRSQCFFKAENLSVFCVFSNYQAAPASGVISTICEFMKLPSAARCGKFWTARW